MSLLLVVKSQGVKKIIWHITIARCTKLYALNAAKNVKSPSNLTAQDPFIAGNALLREDPKDQALVAEDIKQPKYSL